MTLSLARRRLLTGALAGATGILTASVLGACDPLPGGDRGSVPPADPDPLEPLLATELGLVASYDAAIEALPAQAARLRAVRTDHAAHAQALRARLDPRRAAAIETTAAASTSSLQGLLAAERAAAKQAREACLAASGERAALLASIAACESSHLVVLS